MQYTWIAQIYSGLSITLAFSLLNNNSDKSMKQSNCCKLPSKATEEGKEEIQEVSASLAAAKEISMDAEVAASL